MSVDEELLAELRSQVEAYGRGQARAEYAMDGTVLSVNDRYADLMGCSAGELIGRNHNSLVPDEVAQSPEYLHFWEELKAGGNPNGESRRVWHGKSDVWIRSTWTPVRNLAAT